jgi:hypothetical protein
MKMDEYHNRSAESGPTREQIIQAFETIRLKLVDNLEEPERSAFWLAVQMRDALRNAAPAQAALSGHSEYTPVTVRASTAPLPDCSADTEAEHGPFFHVTQEEKDTCEVCERQRRGDAFWHEMNAKADRNERVAADNERMRKERLASRIAEIEPSWLPMAGHVRNVTFTLDEADLVIAALTNEPQTVPMPAKKRPADCLDPMGCLWKHVPTSPEIGLYLCSRSGCPHTTSAGSAHSRSHEGGRS